MDTWPKHHPDWEYRLWTDADLPVLDNADLFERAPSYAMKADLLRYEILVRHGGIYIDADFECHRPLDRLMERVEDLLLVSEFGTVCNQFMGSVAGDPFLARCVASARTRMEETTPREWEERPHLITGPGLVDELFVELDVAVERPESLLPGDYFFEPRTRVPRLLDVARRKRYATHEALASWRQVTWAQRVRDLKPRTRWRRFLDLSHP
jgi:hypothetical protein